MSPWRPDRHGIQAVLTGHLPETGGTKPAKLSEAGSGLLITGLPVLLHVGRDAHSVFAERGLGEDLVQPLSLRKRKLRISVAWPRPQGYAAMSRTELLRRP